MLKLRRRLLTGSMAAAIATAALVAVGSSAPATAASDLTLPSTPGKASTSWKGTAPFNSGQSGLVWGQLGVDDPTEACDPSNTSLNSQHLVHVSFPKSIPDDYETLVRFSVKWTDDAGGNTTNDMALYLFGPDGKLVAGDLQVTTDYRNVLGEVVGSRFPDRPLSEVFPGLAYRPLGLMA